MVRRKTGRGQPALFLSKDVLTTHFLRPQVLNYLALGFRAAQHETILYRTDPIPPHLRTTSCVPCLPHVDLRQIPDFFCLDMIS